MDWHVFDKISYIAGMAVNMRIHGKIRAVTIDMMVCRDCEYRFHGNDASSVLNCHKYVFGKPSIILDKNRCDLHISEDEIPKVEKKKKKVSHEKRRSNTN